MEITIIFVYSPKKNRANEILECSVKKPLTYSDSASGRSKGLRLVSASAAIINKIAIGNKAKNKLIGCCAAKISNRFTVPNVKITVKIIRDKETE